MADIRPFETLAQNEDVTGLLREVCARLSDIADNLSHLSPDATGALRVNGVTIASHPVTLASTAITTVNSLALLTNLAQIGGMAANQDIIAQTQMAEAQLRSNIVIS